MKDPRRQESSEYRRRSVDRHDRSRQPKAQQQERRWQNRNPARQQGETAPKVSRKDSCPFLVRVSYALNTQNAPGDKPQHQIWLHLWMNASLREISQVLRAHIPTIRNKQHFHFWRIPAGQNTKEDLGGVVLHRRSDRNDDKFLGNSRFIIGDTIDVSITYK